VYDIAADESEPLFYARLIIIIIIIIINYWQLQLLAT